MKKIVVTGSNGFIGKVLVKKLEELGFDVWKITRLTNEDDFYYFLKNCDFCFHFAGEVRPNATNEDFYNNNIIYTKKIINVLKVNNNIPSILYTSTIHANNPNNYYAHTKIQSEIIVSEYSNLIKANSFIFRLPHLFGPGCKPNYNSALTTWAYNCCNNIDINIVDKNIEMKYIHVFELVDSFIKQMYQSKIIDLPTTYNITLGDLKNKIIYLHDYYDSREELSQFDKYIFDIITEMKLTNNTLCC